MYLLYCYSTDKCISRCYLVHTKQTDTLTLKMNILQWRFNKTISTGSHGDSKNQTKDDNRVDTQAVAAL